MSQFSDVNLRKKCAGLRLQLTHRIPETEETGVHETKLESTHSQTYMDNPFIFCGSLLRRNPWFAAKTADLIPMVVLIVSVVVTFPAAVEVSTDVTVYKYGRATFQSCGRDADDPCTVGSLPSADTAERHRCDDTSWMAFFNIKNAWVEPALQGKRSNCGPTSPNTSKHFPSCTIRSGKVPSCDSNFHLNTTCVCAGTSARGGCHREVQKDDKHVHACI